MVTITKVGKHGGTLVGHQFQDLKVPVQTLVKTKNVYNYKFSRAFEIQNIHHIVCVYSWLKTKVALI